MSDIDEFKKLGFVWNTLLEHSVNDRVFLTHEWFLSWWQAFGAGKSLFVITLKRGNDTIAIAPLIRYLGVLRGVPARIIEFMANDDSPGCDFIIKKHCDAALETIVSFLVGRAKTWDVIRFRNMRESGYVPVLLRTLDSLGHKKYLVTEGLHSPYLRITSDWDSYFADLSVRTRKTLRNVRNRVVGLNNVSVCEHKTADNLKDMEHVSQNAWKYSAGEAFLNKKDRREFFRLLSAVAQDKGWLSIWCLNKDGKAIAYEYHLSYKEVETALLAEFDETYRALSPGTYLDYEVVKALHDRGFREYDLCGSEDEYKKKWTSKIRTHYHVTVYSGSFRGRCILFLESRFMRLMKRARDRFIRRES